MWVSEMIRRRVRMVLVDMIEASKGQHGDVKGRTLDMLFTMHIHGPESGPG